MRMHAPSRQGRTKSAHRNITVLNRLLEGFGVAVVGAGGGARGDAGDGAHDDEQRAQDGGHHLEEDEGEQQRHVSPRVELEQALVVEPGEEAVAAALVSGSQGSLLCEVCLCSSISRSFR